MPPSPCPARAPASFGIGIDIGDGEAASNDIPAYLIPLEGCGTAIVLTLLTGDKLFARLSFFASGVAHSDEALEVGNGNKSRLLGVIKTRNDSQD